MGKVRKKQKQKNHKQQRGGRWGREIRHLHVEEREKMHWPATWNSDKSQVYWVERRKCKWCEEDAFYPSWAPGKPHRDHVKISVKDQQRVCSFASAAVIKQGWKAHGQDKGLSYTSTSTSFRESHAKNWSGNKAGYCLLSCFLSQVQLPFLAFPWLST